MKGDLIYPKNCIALMPWAWRIIMRIMQKWFMSKAKNKEVFEKYNVDLMARDKETGGFVKTPWFLDEHFVIKK